MNLLNETKLTFTRYGSGDIDDSGKWVETSSSDIVAYGSLQPLDRGEISRVTPEGIKVKSAFYFSTTTELFPADVNTQKSADVTFIKGQPYEVFESADSTFTTMVGMGYYEFLLIRRDKKNAN